MKNKSLLILLILATFANHKSFAQEFDNIFRGGPEDAETYLQNYIAPIMNSFTNGLSGGWNNTAKPHKLLGFDITLTGNIASIPSSDETWTFMNSEFTNISTNSGSSTELPTILGGSTNETLQLNPTIVINGVEFTSEFGEVAAADGIDLEGFSGLPVPALQLGIGLVKNTDLKIRYVPTIDTEELEFSLFGIGVLHDLKQWIPGLKQVPIDVSGFIGYTGLRAEYFITDSELGDDQFTLNASGASTEFSASSTVIQILASKKIAVLTPYVGIGYNATGSSFDVKGDFTYTDSNTLATTTVSNPVSLDFDGGSSATLMAGLRLKLLILTFHADYTIQKYNTLSAGIGINVR